MKHLLVLLIFVTFSAIAAGVYVNSAVNDRGQVLIHIINNTNRNLNCHIWNANYTYSVSFFLPRMTTSPWYFEPQGPYEWSCN